MNKRPAAVKSVKSSEMAGIGSWMHSVWRNCYTSTAEMCLPHKCAHFPLFVSGMQTLWAIDAGEGPVQLCHLQVKTDH